MGRTPTVNQLPPHMRSRLQKSGKVYYYLDLGGKPRVEKPLGSDFPTALIQYAQLTQNYIKGNIVTFQMVIDRYIREVLPKKSASTQKDYLKAVKHISLFFNDPPAPINEIKASHLRQYLDWRGKASQKRANTERSLISTMFNHARAWGYTDNVNPCQGIKPFMMQSRTIYVEDNIYNAVYEHACQPLKDALDLGYLTAQRPGDVIKMYETDIRDGALLVEQGKTGAKLQISITGLLKTVIDRILARRSAFKVRSLALVLDEYGKPLSQHAIWARFNKAKKTAAEYHPKLKEQILAYQIRDLRAKAITDIRISGGIQQAQKLAGHTTEKMTQIYVRNIIGEKVEPTK